jgi:hypothetical protein
MSLYYGYDFTERNSGGLGAIIHDVMNAVQYSEQNNLIFGFIKEGYDIPRLNGSIDDNSIPDKYWHSYFISFPIIEKMDCIEIWPKFLPNTKLLKWDIIEFSNLLKNKICIFQPEIYSEINNLVSIDILLQNRQTDKISEVNKFLPIEKYIDECEYVLQELKYLNNNNNNNNRIYICTDNVDVCLEIKKYFSIKNIDVVWDNSESKDPLQFIRWSGKLSKTIAQKETMNAFKNIFIMRDSKYLIGGRMSYFFRIAELLRFPNKTINIQDNEIFGIAQYSIENYIVRPYMKKSFPNFINKNVIDNKENIEKYNKIYNKKNIITIPSFISENILDEIKKDIENYKWWTYAILSKNTQYQPSYSENINIESIQNCNDTLLSKNFSYRFKRCLGKHYTTCWCVSCRLRDTVSSFHVTDLLCKIVGCRNMIPGEIFLSNYGKDDFLSTHHDINKGDISVTFSLTYDWDPTYGGILHFVDDDNNIYNSIIPKLGSVNIFKLNQKKGLNHFVSTINVNKNRYTLTAWYNII